jgi:hypothetical protein
MQVLTALLLDEVRKYPDGRVDLLGLFEDVYFDEVPVTLESLSLFVDLLLEDGDKGRPHTLVFSIRDEEGTALQEPTRVRFAVPPPDQFPRSTAQLDMALFNVTFHRFGPHAIEIATEDGAVLRRVPMYVDSALRRGGIPGAETPFPTGS